MEATAAYPQWPPVLVSAGLGGAIAAPSPDRIPLRPVMVSDPRERARRGGVDCVGVLRACHRNLAGYSYLRPLKRTQYRSLQRSDAFARAEDRYFHRTHRDYFPHELVVSHLQEVITNERDSEIPKWQGNALTGVELSASRDHAVFFPTGQILQQACMYRSSRDRKRRRVSNTVECGTVIRQLELLGSRDTYEMYGASTVYVAARGAANCTVLSASFGGDGDDSVDTLTAVDRLKFDEMLYHVAASPHTESDLAFVTWDGKVHTWDSLGGVQAVDMKNVSVDERLLRCEYSSNPCVLWTANRVRVETFDLRDRQSASVSLFDLVKMNAPHSEIYSVKRRERSPFQLIVGTSVSIELLDSRMPGKALLSWQQRHSIETKVPYCGAIDEIQWGHASRPDSGLILSTTQGRKTVSLYPFTRNDLSSTTDASPFLSIAPVRSAHQPRGTTSQYIAADSPLDVQLRDGSEWTTLVGMCALGDDDTATSAAVYQLSSWGDLFCQQIRPSKRDEMYETAVQLELPCGVTAQNDPEDEDNGDTQLPVPTDAILPEHDAESLASFVLLPVRPFLESFPRLPAADAVPIDGFFKLQKSHDAINSLRMACRPSATLFRLHRFVNDDLGVPISSSDLLQVLRSHSEFSVRSVHHRFRQRVATVLDPTTATFDWLDARTESDARLAVCTCCAQTATEPCESVACIVPHALIVSSASSIHTEACFPSARAHQDAMSDEFAVVLEQARQVYGQKE